ncbi:MAG: long-chain-fatty-acid--CoA ligase, partial [Planctomycetes bacterium]|nr:long-chain-fatty-acid--CoA ligase [Planctomycetota bacterium]
RPGDRLGILEDNSSAFLESYFAAAGLGAVLVPLNIRLSARELRFILEDAGVRWLLAGGRFRALLEEVFETRPPLEGLVWIDELSHLVPVPSCTYATALGADPAGFTPAPVDAAEPAHLYYTSGTTGEPKGVVLTHRNVCTHALAAIAELQLTDRDAWGHIAPMFHLADAWAVFAATWVGASHAMLPRFEAGAALEAIARERITITNLIPTMLYRMVGHPAAATTDTSSLRLLLSGGAPIAPEVVRRIVETFGCEYAQTYGMTETSPYLTVSLLKEHLAALDPETQLAYRSKTGRPFLGVELEVVNEAGVPVAPDEKEVGEIRVRGDTVTPGYYRREAETRAAFDAEGWLRTGDLAVVDAEGYLTIVDRKKDVILSGGETIYSIEVENVLCRHEGVLEAAVIGLPDALWGETVHAVVVRRAGATLTDAALLEFLRGQLAAFKVPKSVEFLDSLPRTGSGKIQKKALRERARPGATGP